ncbi:MAG: Lipopolysaccharide biosynthesis protein WzxC [Cyanobacteria bacterium RYN_339]|nr:Lipopolysaccharide biosynthesis protein WzxC [Cyanobacteria bacterium RYN_339]
MSTLAKASISGIKWSALTQLVAQIAQYGSFVLLARLLSPEDFGVVACATLVVNFVAMLNELGLGAALIQRSELTAGHLNACFWSNVAAGLALALVVGGSAGWVAGFFHSPATAPLLVALALGFPMIALAVVPKTLMEKALRFKELGLVDAGAAIANASVAVTMAATGWGAWSLVAGTLVGYAIQLVAVWPLAGWKPGLRFARTELNELFAFGLNVLGTRVVGYVNANIDYIVIGRMLGPAALGVYSLAYKLVTWPMLKISHVVLRVMFPAFARIQDDDEALRRHYGTLVGTLALVTYPLLAGLAVMAPEALPLVFGPRWAGAVEPVRALCLAGALKATICSIGTVFLTKGRPDLEFRSNMLGTVMLAIYVPLGVRFGTEGVAYAIALVTLVGGSWQQLLANRLLGLDARTYLAAIRPQALAALAGAAALVALRWAGQALPPLALLALAVPLFGGVYLGLLTALGYNWPKRLSPAGVTVKLSRFRRKGFTRQAS